MPVTATYAHTAKFTNGDPNPDVSSWQLQRDHLIQVAKLAVKHAAPIGMEQEAELAGMLHDLGKYAERFQSRLHNSAIQGINHWAAGAYHAMRKLCSPRVAFAIDGHHTGIPPLNFSASSLWDKSTLKETCSKFDKDQKRVEFTGCSESDSDLINKFCADGLSVGTPSKVELPQDRWFEESLKIRFLFSCLVDADFLDTELHFNPGKHTSRKSVPIRAEANLDVLVKHINELTLGAPPGPVKNSRERLFRDCITAAERSASLYTLTAPTGSGKTLASLAFALKHILHKNAELPLDSPKQLRRIIVVIPYSSIIEQTARTYRELFGEDYALEHHSSSEPKDTRFKYQNRLAAENWDAPLVVTTNVQFFESLFSNHPFRCRKLHNIARSVILFDEVQTLPIQLVPSLLSAIKLLTSEPYGCSSVFMTATQPAFSAVGSELEPQGWNPVEISSDPEAMADDLKRTRITFPKPDETISNDQLIEEMVVNEQSLCVVNSTAFAAEIFTGLQNKLSLTEEAFHLSAKMCPAHRQEKLGTIKDRLRQGKRTFLVSTQLIEAGVDIDFPAAFRAMGPLDSIIQTAGRCNREGRFAEACPVKIFRPKPNKMPRGTYETATNITEQFLARLPAADIHQPETYRRYFEELYKFRGGTDEVLAASRKLDFPMASDKCKLIEEGSHPVLVKWKRGLELVSELIHKRLLTRDECREVQRYSVNLFDRDFQAGISNGSIYQPVPDWPLHVWNSEYDENLGICNPTEFIL